MYLAWPFSFLFSLWDMFVAPLLFGPFRPYGRFQYKGAICEVKEKHHVEATQENTSTIGRKTKPYFCAEESAVGK